MLTEDANNRSTTITWADPAELVEARKRMSGLEFLRALRDGSLPPPPMASLLGFWLVEAEPGRVVYVATPAEYHYNLIGVVHGGFAMTLLDSTMACSIQTQLAAGTGFTTLEVKVNMVRAITLQAGKLRAIGTIVHPGRSIATAEGRIEDESGKLYAHGSTTCMVMSR